MTKLDRINANYEHDKAVLAKEDPMFAKNKFWDVRSNKNNKSMAIRSRKTIQRNRFIRTNKKCKRIHKKSN